jgi:lysophospholipase II
MRWCTPFEEERWAWFDTFSLDDLTDRENLQVEGLRDGVFLIKQIIQEEVERLDGKAEKVIFGGFSQGSALAMWSLFMGTATINGSLGALVGVGAWMPFAELAKKAVATSGPPAERIQALAQTFASILEVESVMKPEAIQASLQIPVFLGHGTDVRIACICFYSWY